MINSGEHTLVLSLGARQANDVLRSRLAPAEDAVVGRRWHDTRAGARIARTHVLVLTTYETDADVLRAIEAGATGYLLKETPRDELFRAVRATAVGQSVLSPSVASRLVGRTRAPEERTLSAREIEVLRHVARGTSNKLIARALMISEATVTTHLLHIFGKLGVDDRTAAVTAALERGIVRLER